MGTPCEGAPARVPLELVLFLKSIQTSRTGELASWDECGFTQLTRAGLGLLSLAQAATGARMRTARSAACGAGMGPTAALSAGAVRLCPPSLPLPSPDPVPCPSTCLLLTEDPYLQVLEERVGAVVFVLTPCPGPPPPVDTPRSPPQVLLSLWTGVGQGLLCLRGPSLSHLRPIIAIWAAPLALWGSSGRSRCRVWDLPVGLAALGASSADGSAPPQSLARALSSLGTGAQGGLAGHTLLSLLALGQALGPAGSITICADTTSDAGHSRATVTATVRLHSSQELCTRTEPWSWPGPQTDRKLGQL